MRLHQTISKLFQAVSVKDTCIPAIVLPQLKIKGNILNDFDYLVITELDKFYVGFNYLNSNIRIRCPWQDLANLRAISNGIALSPGNRVCYSQGTYHEFHSAAKDDQVFGCLTRDENFRIKNFYFYAMQGKITVSLSTDPVYGHCFCIRLMFEPIANSSSVFMIPDKVITCRIENILAKDGIGCDIIAVEQFINSLKKA